MVNRRRPTSAGVTPLSTHTCGLYRASSLPGITGNDFAGVGRRHRAMEARGTSAMEAQGTSPNFEAIRALHLADRSLGADKLIAKLKQQRPDLNVSASEVRATLRSLRKQAKEEAAAAEARTIALREALLGAEPSSGAGPSSGTSASGPSQS